MATSITPDDNTRVESSTTSKGSGLAFTGSTSLPLVILGALLLLAGVTAVLVDRRRSRSAGVFHGDG
ncbi:MAG: LPXTG cell wall anchor domain-containing protein [Actinobacteria bacterium]|nr:LPXTG cell wall anchor domain-containing protein [Actinomycetota bacterium]